MNLFWRILTASLAVLAIILRHTGYPDLAEYALWVVVLALIGWAIIDWVKSKRLDSK